METQWRSGLNVESEQLLRQGLDRLGISLADEQVNALMVYFHELKKWSRRINLIARESDDARIIESHFLDSLTLKLLLDQAPLEGGGLLDVGTGAGFPGLVLAVAVPELQVTLVEPRKKRVSFLQHIVRTLGLKNVRIFSRRIEEVGLDEESGYRFVTSRAVTSPLHFLPMVHRFLEKGAAAVLMVAKQERLDEVSELDQPYGFDQMLELELPFSGASRILGVVSLSQ